MLERIAGEPLQSAKVALQPTPQGIRRWTASGDLRDFNINCPEIKLECRHFGGGAEYVEATVLSLQSFFRFYSGRPCVRSNANHNWRHSRNYSGPIRRRDRGR